MPAASGPRTSVTTLEVPPGTEGLDHLSGAVTASLAGGSPVALIPGYAPADVRHRLRQQLVEAPMAALDPDAAVLCPTSGSTGDPRFVILSRSALRSAAAARDHGQGGPSAWFVALPTVTAATLIAVVRGHLHGLPVVGWPGIGGARRFTPEAFTAAARELLMRASAAAVPARTSLVPAQLGRLLADEAAVALLRTFDRVLIGGGPLGRTLADRARELDLPITTTYGMTETCGGCVYDGVATLGTRFALAPDAEILLGGDCLANGYLDGPLPLRNGLLRTGDRGRVDDSGKLHVLGRFDDIVTVRGANVDLAAVAAVVNSVPQVQEAAVVAEPDPDGGHILVAHVTGRAVDPQMVRAAVLERLGPAAVPRVRRVDALPRLAGGKVDTRRLAKGTR